MRGRAAVPPEFFEHTFASFDINCVEALGEPVVDCAAWNRFGGRSAVRKNRARPWSCSVPMSWQLIVRASSIALAEIGLGGVGLSGLIRSSPRILRSRAGKRLHRIGPERLLDRFQRL